MRNGFLCARNCKRFDTLTGYLSTGHIIIGGNHHREQLYIAPTLIDGVSLDDPIMQEEIFGPILPIITYTTLNEAEQIIQRNPYPLSLYIFTRNEKTAQRFTEQIAFGGGCINNTLIHFTNMNMPFGGVGYSGMGRYHGQYGFDTFSHRKSIMKTATWLDVAVKYAPFGNKLKLAKWFMK